MAVPILVRVREAIQPEAIRHYEERLGRRIQLGLIVFILAGFLISGLSVYGLYTEAVESRQATATREMMVALQETASLATARAAEEQRILVLTYTLTFTPVPTRTYTPTATLTLTPSATETPTNTATFTLTPRPSATPTTTGNLAATRRAEARFTEAVERRNAVRTELAQTRTQEAADETDRDPPRNRNRVPRDATLMNNGRGLSDNRRVDNGEFQVEGYCAALNRSVRRDDNNWYCGSSRLRSNDFDDICNLTYGVSFAFAIQSGNSRTPAYNWACYAYESDVESLENTRLRVGGEAVVLLPGDSRINVRSAPRTSGRIVTTVASETDVNILDGPRSGSGYTWWRIRLPNGDRGWMVERLDDRNVLYPR